MPGTSTKHRPSKPTEFGNLLKEFLYERGITQVDLANRVGVAPESLSRAMRGRRRPSGQLVLAISEALALLEPDEARLLAAAGYKSAGGFGRTDAPSHDETGRDDQPASSIAATQPVSPDIRGIIETLHAVGAAQQAMLTEVRGQQARLERLEIQLRKLWSGTGAAIAPESPIPEMVSASIGPRTREERLPAASAEGETADLVRAIEALLKQQARHGALSAGPAKRLTLEHGWTEVVDLEQVADFTSRLLKAAEVAAMMGAPFSNEEIRVGLFANDVFAAASGDRREKVWESLGAVIDAGGAVTHIVRLEEHDRPFALIGRMLGMLQGPGDYAPRYLTSASDRGHTPDLLVVPAVGALELVSAGNGTVVATFVPRKENEREIRALSARLDPLLRDAPALVAAHLPHSDDHGEAVVEREERDGDRFLVMPYLSHLSQPDWIAEKRARELRDRDDRTIELADREVEHRKARRAAMVRQLQEGRSRFRQLCLPSAVAATLLKNDPPLKDMPPFDDWFTALGADPVVGELAAHHVRGAIELLERYPDHFQLGFLDEKDADVFRPYWMVKGTDIVFVEAWRPTIDAGNLRNLHITHPAAVAGFRGLFEHYWDRRSAELDDNEKVIAWMRDQLRVNGWE